MVSKQHQQHNRNFTPDCSEKQKLKRYQLSKNAKLSEFVGNFDFPKWTFQMLRKCLRCLQILSKSDKTQKLVKTSCSEIFRIVSIMSLTLTTPELMTQNFPRHNAATIWNYDILTRLWHGDFGFPWLDPEIFAKTWIFLTKFSDSIVSPNDHWRRIILLSKTVSRLYKPLPIVVSWALWEPLNLHKTSPES